MPAKAARPTADRLRPLIAERLKTLVEEAEQPGGRIAAERLTELHALAASLEVADKLRPARLRWATALALTLTLVVTSVLLFVRVPRTAIELDASVSELAFKLAGEQAVTEMARLRFLGIAGAAGFEPSHRMKEIMRKGEAATANTLALHAGTADPQCVGSITLERIILPRDARVALRRPSEGDRLQLLLNAAGAELRATVEGCLRLGGSAAMRWQAGTPQMLTILLGAEEVDLDVESTADARLRFASAIPASDLSLARVEQAGRGESLVVRHVSTVAAGSIFFPALGGESRKLRHSELIRFSSTNGELRSIELDDSRIAVRYHGDVRDMTSGKDVDARSLMPTLLEWLASNHSLSLLWGSAMYLFGLAASLLRWGRINA